MFAVVRAILFKTRLCNCPNSFDPRGINVLNLDIKSLFHRQNQLDDIQSHLKLA